MRAVSQLTRRRFLIRIFYGTIGATAAVSRAVRGAEPPPLETGLPYEGLLKNTPGFQPRTPAALPVEAIPGFLSKRQLAETYAVYRTAFSNLLAAERALSAAARNAAGAGEYARLRQEQTRAANSVLLHEFYFRNLTAKSSIPSRYALSNMTEHMGSITSWREDFAACARVAETWAALVYDPYDDRWHNVPMGESDAGGWVGANPLVVLKIAPSAYSLDYKDRDSYIAAFFKHIDWREVAARYRAADRH